MSGWEDKDVDYLAELQGRVEWAEVHRRVQVALLRERGCPWSVIADALGVSKQSAHRKYSGQALNRSGAPWPVAAVGPGDVGEGRGPEATESDSPPS